MSHLTVLSYGLVVLWPIGCSLTSSTVVEPVTEPAKPVVDWTYVRSASSEDLIPLLKSTDVEVRRMVAAELGHNRRDLTALPYLITALREERDDTAILRLAAVLVKYREQSAIDAVVILWLEKRSLVNQDLLTTGLYGANPCMVEIAMQRHGHIAPDSPIPVRSPCPVEPLYLCDDAEREPDWMPPIGCR